MELWSWFGWRLCYSFNSHWGEIQAGCSFVVVAVSFSLGGVKERKERGEKEYKKRAVKFQRSKMI